MEIIEAARREMNLNISDIADALDIDPKQVTDLMAGDLDDIHMRVHIYDFMITVDMVTADLGSSVTELRETAESHDAWIEFLKTCI